MSVVQLQEHLVRYLCAGHQTDRTTTDDGYLDLVYPDWYMYRYIETTIVSVLYVIYCLVMYCESLINITTAEVVLFLFANKCIKSGWQLWTSFLCKYFFSISITMYKHYKLTMFVKNPNNTMYRNVFFLKKRMISLWYRIMPLCYLNL